MKKFWQKSERGDLEIANEAATGGFHSHFPQELERLSNGARKHFDCEKMHFEPPS